LSLPRKPSRSISLAALTTA